ncbi:hypothetical protein NL676_010820 [Syzygium grande]|nr:hypothetical protein NL676_010820 [Syzygium grande]
MEIITSIKSLARRSQASYNCRNARASKLMGVRAAEVQRRCALRDFCVRLVAGDGRSGGGYRRPEGDGGERP